MAEEGTKFLCYSKVSDVFSLSWLVWGGCAAITCLSLWLRSRLYIDGDIGVYLFLADKLLHGGRYYYNFFEFNLPLVFYIVAIAVYIAHLLGTSVIATYTAFITVVSWGSMLLSARVLRDSVIYAQKPLYRALIVAICCIFLLPSLTLHFDAIGDKSFFLIACILPYFCSCVMRRRPLSRPLTLLVGVVAGIGFCLKPHYVLLWAGIELYLLCVRRRPYLPWRAMNLYISAVIAAYLLSLFYLFPEYIRLMLPIAHYFYLYPFNVSLLRLIQADNYFLFFDVGAILIPVMFLIVVAGENKKEIQEKDDTRQLFLYGFCVAFIELIAELHVDGFQQIQLYAFAALLFTALTVYFFQHIRHFSLWRFACGVFVITTIFYLYPCAEVIAAYQGVQQRNVSLDETLAYAERYAKGKSLLVLSPNLSDAFPLVNYSHSHWNYKFFFVPALYAFKTYQMADKTQWSPEALAHFHDAERYFYDALDGAMTYDPPALIIALEKTSVSKSFWNFPDDLSKDGVFLQEWKQYKKIAEINHTDANNEPYSLGVYIRP